MWLNSIVFCFLILNAADFFGFAEALKSGDNGVCVVKISVKKTRTKMVTINKWCGKKKCVKKKVETYNAPVDTVVCCKGWEYDVNNDTCGPVCSTGCKGGRCVAPEVCQCDPPATLDLEHSNTCLQPVCDQPCVNAHCENNTCICSPEFTKFNSTHCYKCDSGFIINDNFTCDPKCKHCDHGICTAPETCTCHEGYKTVDDSCTPVCNVCVNSTCVAPNTCSCLEGYERFNETVCVPKCVDCDGDCVAPDLCICHPGFKNVSGVCVPECEGCKDGKCTAPGQCTCNRGYVKDVNDTTVCLRNCEQPEEIVESGSKLTYVCCKDWKYVRSKDKCIPQCKRGCKNGTCVSPNVCQCDPPMVLVDENKCITPVCDHECVNSQCGPNNTCTCNAGFVNYNRTHCVNQCNDGYHNHPDTLNCVPKCKIPCENGLCTEPDKCTCHVGYKNVNDFHCEPICDIACKFGVCSAPNVCTCDRGYKNSDSLNCVPVCDEKCEKGTCTGPNVCTCNEGYELDEKSKFKCVPTCSPECKNAYCSEPNKCSCYSGYETAGNNWTCKPYCKEPCINGNCTNPGNCSCYHGYEKVTSSICKRPCEGPCDHGTCSLQGICRCDEGYKFENNTCIDTEPVQCESCKYNCSNVQDFSQCKCDDGRICLGPMVETQTAETRMSAGLGLIVVAAVAVLILTALVVGVMHRLYKKRKTCEKEQFQENFDRHGSIVYSCTVPDSLIRDASYDANERNTECEDDDVKTKTDRLLSSEAVILDERL